MIAKENSQFDGEKCLRSMSITKTFGNGAAEYPYQGIIPGRTTSEIIAHANEIRGYLKSQGFITKGDFILHDLASDKIPFLELTDAAHTRLQQILQGEKLLRLMQFQNKPIKSGSYYSNMGVVPGEQIEEMMGNINIIRAYLTAEGFSDSNYVLSYAPENKTTFLYLTDDAHERLQKLLYGDRAHGLGLGS